MIHFGERFAEQAICGDRVSARTIFRRNVTCVSCRHRLALNESIAAIRFGTHERLVSALRRFITTRGNAFVMVAILAACTGTGSRPDAGSAQCHIADKACWIDAAPSCPSLLFGVRLCSELPSSDCQRVLDENSGTGLDCPVTNFSYQPCWCHTAVVGSEGWCQPDWSGR